MVVALTLQSAIHALSKLVIGASLYAETVNNSEKQ